MDSPSKGIALPPGAAMSGSSKQLKPPFNFSETLLFMLFLAFLLNPRKFLFPGAPKPTEKGIPQPLGLRRYRRWLWQETARILRTDSFDRSSGTDGDDGDGGDDDDKPSPPRPSGTDGDDGDGGDDDDKPSPPRPSGTDGGDGNGGDEDDKPGPPPPSASGNAGSGPEDDPKEKPSDTSKPEWTPSKGFGKPHRKKKNTNQTPTSAFMKWKETQEENPLLGNKPEPETTGTPPGGKPPKSTNLGTTQSVTPKGGKTTTAGAIATPMKAAPVKAAEQKTAGEKAAEEKAAREKAAREKAAKEEAAKEKAFIEKRAQLKAAEYKAAQEKARGEKAAEYKAAQEKAKREKEAAETAVKKVEKDAAKIAAREEARKRAQQKKALQGNEAQKKAALEEQAPKKKAEAVATAAKLKTEQAKKTPADKAVTQAEPGTSVATVEEKDPKKVEAATRKAARQQRAALKQKQDEEDAARKNEAAKKQAEKQAAVGNSASIAAALEKLKDAKAAQEKADEEKAGENKKTLLKTSKKDRIKPNDEFKPDGPTWYKMEAHPVHGDYELDHAHFWRPLFGVPKETVTRAEQAEAEAYLESLRNPSPTRSIREDGRRVRTNSTKGRSVLFSINHAEEYRHSTVPIAQADIIVDEEKTGKRAVTMAGAKDGDEEPAWEQYRWHGHY